TQWHPGTKACMGTYHTLFSLEAGAVTFNKKANGRTYVSVNPITKAAE
ncbi:50S ribosomal protein L27, partial [Mesorhizobium sp. M00.F.Ca.ET.149.01.1.1]